MTAAAAVLEAASDDDDADERARAWVCTICGERCADRAALDAHRRAPAVPDVPTPDAALGPNWKQQKDRQTAPPPPPPPPVAAAGDGGNRRAARSTARRGCATVRLEDGAAPPRLSKWVRTSAELAKALPSKTTFAEALKAGRLVVNGAVATVDRVNDGDVVELILLPDAAAATVVPPEMEMVHVEGRLAVVWKPRGVRACGAHRGTLQSALAVALPPDAPPAPPARRGAASDCAGHSASSSLAARGSHWWRAPRAHATRCERTPRAARSSTRSWCSCTAATHRRRGPRQAAPRPPCAAAAAAVAQRARACGGGRRRQRRGGGGDGRRRGDGARAVRDSRRQRCRPLHSRSLQWRPTRQALRRDRARAAPRRPPRRGRSSRRPRARCAAEVVRRAAAGDEAAAGVRRTGCARWRRRRARVPAGAARSSCRSSFHGLEALADGVPAHTPPVRRPLRLDLGSRGRHFMGRSGRARSSGWRAQPSRVHSFSGADRSAA